MDISDIQAYKGHPALLDRLAIAAPNGDVMVRFGLGAELYVEPRKPMQALWQDMLALQEDYYNRFHEFLNQARFKSADRVHSKVMRLGFENPFVLFQNGLDNYSEDELFSNVLWRQDKHPDYPKDSGDVSIWISDILVARSFQKDMATFSCHLPVTTDGKNAVLFDTLREAFLQWCNLCRPAHGGAGFCVVLTIAGDLGEKYAYSTLQRHPGLDIIRPIKFTGALPKGVCNRIKSVSWLTALGDPVLNELGGLDAARRVLEPDCIIHTYPGGVVIQAGDIPQLGDSYTGDIPEVYRKVARFTKPVRFEDYKKSSLFRVFEPLDRVEETMKWVRRFD